MSEIGSKVRMRRLLDDAHRFELAIVGAIQRPCELGMLYRVASVTNTLGNGWLYLLLVIVLLVVSSPNAYLAMATSALAVGASHALYPWIKRRIARLRPYEKMPHLPAVARAMDRYSFPSGHCMTSTAVGVPLAQAYPELTWIVVAGCLLIAWARMACAHHYPSDLVAGSALGALMAYASIEVVSIGLLLQPS